AEPVHQLDLAGVDVAPAHVEAQWHALELPVRVLVSGPLIAPVDAITDPGRLEAASPAFDERLDLAARLVVSEDRHHDHLDWRHLGRDDEAGIVAVRHYERSDETRADPPRRRVAELAFVAGVRERDVVGAREVLPEIVRGAHLQREPVAHETFDRKGVNRARERFRGRFFTAENWNCQPVFGYGAVVAQYQA